MKMTLNWMMKRTKEEMIEIKWSREDHEGVVEDEKVRIKLINRLNTGGHPAIVLTRNTGQSRMTR